MESEKLHDFLQKQRKLVESILGLMSNKKLYTVNKEDDNGLPNAENFPNFFMELLKLLLNENLSFLEQTALITFLDNCFNSLVGF